MKGDEDILTKILEEETTRVRSAYPGKDVIFPLVEAIRTLDYHSLILKVRGNLTPQDHALLSQKYRFGWALVFLLYYKDLESNDAVPLFSYEKSERDWVDQIVQHAGAIQLTHQLLSFCKADLMTVCKEDDTFIFGHTNAGSAEYYEKLSTDYYFEIIDKVLEAKKRGYIERLPKMRSKLKDIVNVMHDKFITYRATDEFDEFYSRLGYLYLMTNQIVDDFAESDIFNGIPYKKYMDQVEYVHRAALMHQDCCLALMYKTSHKINLRDILTYGFSLKTFSESLGSYMGDPPEQVRQVVSCLSITKENYDHHLSYPGVTAPPYFQLGSDTLMRSVYGCLDKPVQFLNRELKRKFPDDFFRAVNNREARFRGELYDLFQKDRIVRINENVMITGVKGSTDIDAILYDDVRGTLGLFQLKWQDSFSTSMKERFSRISNLVPKSVEWIDKVSAWLQATDERSVLKTLKIETSLGKIGDVHLFVIGRHHVHFTNQKLDDRAIWASWFQLLEATAKVKDPRQTNPIAELAAKLKFFSPDSRRERETERRPLDLEMKFSKYKIVARSM